MAGLSLGLTNGPIVDGTNGAYYLMFYTGMLVYIYILQLEYFF